MARVDPMYEMLEGQVAVLSSGLLSAEEVLALLDALWRSAMVQQEHGSFMLYPDRALPGFLEKNVIASGRLETDPLLAQLLAAGRSEVVERDAQGNVRFSSDFRHAGDLQVALDRLAREAEWTPLVASGRAATLETFEQTFQHHAFTGRSGTMFRYEGLGSIYWHMVSKLLLAIAECLRAAQQAGASADTVARLTDHYRRVRAGLGPNKTPEQYGAFPSDPYSHSPRGAGAQQPGMTGQVKEEILTRLGELGVQVRDGKLGFGMGLLDRTDFRGPADASGLDFTFAGTPVHYRLDPAAKAPHLEVELDGVRHQSQELQLTPELSRHVFARDRVVRRIVLSWPADPLHQG